MQPILKDWKVGKSTQFLSKSRNGLLEDGATNTKTCRK